MSGPRALLLDPSVVLRLKAQLPDVAVHTVAAVIAEVPAYTVALDGPMGGRIGEAVQMALGGFLNLAGRRADVDSSSPLAPALDAAYALGRGEARGGRSMDALLAAYRVGARVAWREFAAVAVAAELSTATMALFAELVFAYIDELSAASVTGHADELATTGRVRQRYLDGLTRSLLTGDSASALVVAAERAAWVPPNQLTALLVTESQARRIGPLTDPRTLRLAGELPGVGDGEELVVLLIPDLDPLRRQRLLTSMPGRHAVLGPSRPWTQAAVSYQRALRTRALALGDGDRDGRAGMIDTEDHLPELILAADAPALADLRSAVLAPLAAMRESTAEKLTETLRAWLLHQGRREDMAAALFVHPQTVRYRMGQLRELFGDRLEDPRQILAMTIALGSPI